MMIRPMKVMMSQTPAIIVAATMPKLTAARAPLTIQKASSVQGRLVKGSRRTRCPSSFILATCSSVSPSDTPLCFSG